MNNSYSPSIRFFRNTLVFATAFAILAVVTLQGFASATTPSQTAVTSITVGTYPTGVAVSPDGSSVWVTNFGDGTVSQIDTATSTVVGSPITVGASPQLVAVSPDGKSVWVTNFGDGTIDGTVSQIDTASDTVVHTITLGTHPVGVAVSPDGSSVWVTN